MMRWTPRRKIEYLAVVDGRDTPAQFIERNRATAEEVASVSADEIAEWRKLYREHGKAGLRTTRVQMYRHRVPGA